MVVVCVAESQTLKKLPKHRMSVVVFIIKCDATPLFCLHYATLLRFLAAVNTKLVIRSI